MKAKGGSFCEAKRLKAKALTDRRGRKIMKRTFFLTIVIVLTLFAAGAVACDDNLNGVQIDHGVYLPAGAEAPEKGEIPSDWVAVKDGKMTVSEDGELTVYKLGKGKDRYNADSADGSLKVSVEGNTLTVDDKGKTTDYVLSGDYEITDIVKEALIPVLEPEIVEDEGKSFAFFRAEYPDESINGISLDIKTAGSSDYKSFCMVKSENGVLSVAIPAEALSTGDNFIRLCNRDEYPMIDADKNLFMKTGSGSIEYKVTVDETGKITSLQNDTVLENGVYKFAYTDELMSSEGKSYWNFVVIDGLLKESYIGGRILYYLSDADGVYSMKIFNPENTASSTFTVKNGIITVTAGNSGKVFQCKKDEGYTYQEESEKLEKPVNPTYAVENYDSVQQIWFRFFALDTYYPVGVRTEIKRAGSEDYEFYDTDVPYRAEICVDGIGVDKLAVGANYIRICNAGAPVSTNDKHYYMTEDSDYITFMVYLYEDGAMNTPVLISE